MGVIPGHIRDEIVILGNHRDAWVNGAADPTSGTVTIVEIIKGLGRLLREGWTPLRTIVIASWDAEEVCYAREYFVFWFFFAEFRETTPSMASLAAPSMVRTLPTSSQSMLSHI
jgi:hypothetical protein